MADYVKFNQFVEDMGSKVHDLQASGDTLKVYLTLAAPDVEADAVKTDLAEITAQNNYPSGGTDIQNTYTRSTTTATLSGTDVVFTASGGSFGPFRYAVLYNDTPTSPVDPLIAYWDYGTETTITDGNDFTVDFGASIFTFT